MEVLHLNNISKSYGKIKALEGISLEMNQGDLMGVIGPDGAGKTTLFRIITTLLLPDSGEARVLRKDLLKDYKKIRSKLGYMPGRFSLYLDLSVEENLSFYARIFGTTIEENYHLIEDIYKQIEPFKKRLAGKLSGGMKQKLALSCALIHKPELLILDEPTTGVDAVSRMELWEMLNKLKLQGISILVSTPYMDEAMLCDRVALIQKGKFMQINSPADIVDSYSRKLFAASYHDAYALLLALRDHPDCNRAHPFGDSVHFTFHEGKEDPEAIIKWMKNKGLSNTKIVPVKAGIEDCFMELMQTNE